MKFAKMAIIVYLLIFNYACTTPKEFNYNNYNVSFICPEGWKIVKENFIEDKSCFIQIKNVGSIWNGQLLIKWEYGKGDLKGYIDNFKLSLQNSSSIPISNLIFSDLYKTAYSNYEALSITTTLKSFDNNVRQTCFAFHGIDKTFIIVQFEFIGHEEENKIGFNIIENSFQNEIPE